jgi:Glycosyltransferase family 28 C-terminal domain
MRTANIATALATIDDPPAMAFHLAAPPPEGLWNDSWMTTVESDRPWADVVALVAPDVVVYDTVLPDDPTRNVPDHARYVFVLRRRTDDRSNELYEDPFVLSIDRIIVPHRADEFIPPLPKELLPKASFVGMIARRPDPAMVQVLRNQRCTSNGLLLTSTVGGGGFIRQADRFFELVEAAGSLLAERIDGFHHVIVLGPNYGNRSMVERLVALPSTQVVQSEQRMVELMAASDLVIAEAGYNTVSEIGLVRVPAVLVPSERSLDDQVERARRLSDEGAVHVLEPTIDPEVFAESVLALATQPDRLALMRRAGRAPDLGNDRAAAIIADLAASTVGARS